MNTEDAMVGAWVIGIVVIVALGVVLHALGKLDEDLVGLSPLVVAWPLIAAALLACAPFVALHRVTKAIHDRVQRVPKAAPAPDPYIAAAEREVEAVLLDTRHTT